jgi:hypothetical protein
MRSFCTASWTLFNFQHLFPCLHFASSRALFSGHWLWPSPFSWLAQVRKHLWRGENDARYLPCSTLLHHREIYIKHVYRILAMPLCNQLCKWIWDAERGFLLIETGLQLQVRTCSFPSSASNSIEKLPHKTKLLVWCRSTQACMTILHYTCQAVCASSWSGKSTSGGDQAGGLELYGGGWASGGHS